jgi:hypothetical protein
MTNRKSLLDSPLNAFFTSSTTGVANGSYNKSTKKCINHQTVGSVSFAVIIVITIVMTTIQHCTIYASGLSAKGNAIPDKTYPNIEPIIQYNPVIYYSELYIFTWILSLLYQFEIQE